MTTLEREPGPQADAPSSPADQTPEHLACVACGYALRGLPQDGACPECGEPIAASLEVLRRWGGSPAALRDKARGLRWARLSLGLTAVVMASPALLLLLLAVAPLAIVIMVAWPLVALVEQGTWVYAVALMTRSEFAADDRPKTAARLALSGAWVNLGVVLAMGGWLLVAAVMGRDGESLLWGLLSLPVIRGLTVLALLGVVTGWAPGRRDGSIRSLRWCGVAAAGCGLLFSLSWLAVFQDRAPLLAATVMLWIGAWVFTVASGVLAGQLSRRMGAMGAPA